MTWTLFFNIGSICWAVAATFLLIAFFLRDRSLDP